MTTDRERFEARLKHLEFIQGVIRRQATNSFLVKGWGLTVVAAAYAAAFSQGSWQTAAAGTLAMLIFWGLDAYYLQQERLFRCLWDVVRLEEEHVDPFCMIPREHKHNARSLAGMMFRAPTVTVFWSGVLVLVAALLLSSLTLPLASRRPSSAEPVQPGTTTPTSIPVIRPAPSASVASTPPAPISPSPP